MKKGCAYDPGALKKLYGIEILIAILEATVAYINYIHIYISISEKMSC